MFRYLRLSPDVFLIVDLFELELIVSILKIEIPYYPSVPVLGIYLKRTKTLTQKDTRTPMFIAALVKIWNQIIKTNFIICNKNGLGEYYVY